MSAVPTPSRPPASRAEAAEIEALLERLVDLRREIGRVIVGQAGAVEQLLIAFLAGGHALLEGVPGLAKTLMVRTLADAVHLSFRRIQFTPDLMPTDVVGTEVLEEDHATGKRFFKFNPGPVFAHIVLADEINRTPPKTQAALLEAMQEGAVTYGGATHPLPHPFFVLATQNPIEQTGTYPLPEAQLDRFLLHLRIAYPSDAEERDILRRTTGGTAPGVRPLLEGADILQAQALTREVHLADDLLDYVARLVRGTRPESTSLAHIKDWVRWGAGPRAGQALVLTAKARAVLHGRFAVTMEDVRAMAGPVLRHRVLVNFRAEAEGIDAEAVTARLLEETPEPKSPLG